MLEYFSYKKIKKHKAEKAAAEEAAQKTHVESTADQTHATVPEIRTDAGEGSGGRQERHNIEHRLSSDTPPLSPVLDKDDESWLRSILEDDSPPPPLPPRINTPQIDLSSASESELEAGKDKDDSKSKKKEKERKKKEEKDKKKEKKEKEKEEKHPNRLTALFTRHKKQEDGLKPEDDVTAQEAEKETNDLGNVLDRLNLQAKNNKIVSLSNESSDLLQRFTQVFKDLANGVPTAYNDLSSLIEDRDGAINRGFEKLPSSLKKLVTQLPEKLTSSLAPELLAAAAESQGLKAEAAEKGLKEAATNLLTPKNLTELVTKPGAVVSMLKAIVNALKVRWPAFIGTNVIWSVALFLLMFVLWYCHKRGREVRLEREKSDAETPIDGSDRIEELPDDPQLPAPETTTSDRNQYGTTRGEPVSPLSEPSPVLVEPAVPQTSARP
ncbi:RING-like domain-containing [Fusarium albosuccineum]|uniref:RING-like domain-containing n=1 Tax=Fusarium albosuccineum TaxID=1237068 RepID=A0A8H4LM46_9HYPO|nr:RING-like domain-containing [Fusarium albosuccineum]